MPITSDRGYLIPAINTDTLDYESCARHLADSIWRWHPKAQITIVTADMLPYGNQQGFANDWQMFKISPYRQTIKLEADMLCSSPIDHWWTMFEHRDVVISQGCRDFYDQLSPQRRYRKFLDQNNLPDVYNAITYWRYSRTAEQFFHLVKNVFQHWQDYRKLFKASDEEPTTDFVYAIVAEMIGRESVTLPPGIGPSIVHMKKGIIPIRTENWTKEMVWEIVDRQVRIQTVAQQGLLHYHVKDWLNNE